MLEGLPGEAGAMGINLGGTEGGKQGQEDWQDIHPPHPLIPAFISLLI